MSTSPYVRPKVLAAVVIGSILLLGTGVFAATRNGHLTKPTPADVAKASAPYDPPTGLDFKAPLPIDGEVGGAGAIEPADRPVALSPELSGVVAEVLVAEGDRVQAGQLLVRLRDLGALAELAAAEADTRTAERDLAATRADAVAAAGRGDLSAASAKRTAALFSKGVATPDDQERAQLLKAADAASAAAATARVSQARSRIEAARAREALARNKAAQHEIKALGEGEILQVLVRPGETASPSAAVVVIGDTRVLRARLDINERDALGVAVGQRARVRIEGDKADITGRVTEVARRVGRKNIRTDDPTDRQDVRFVETVVELDAAPRVPIGIRVQGYITVGSAKADP